MSPEPPVDLTPFVKAYDVRGLVGTQLTDAVVTAFGAAFVDEIGAAGQPVVIGHDMRESSPGFAAAFARGARARGGDVVAIGLCSTDESYFASGTLHAAAAMFTASHNPATYNGIKLSRAGARGISFETGLEAIRDRATAYLAGGDIPEVTPAGGYREQDVLADYAAYLRGLVDLSGIRPLKVVVDAGNGMAGLTVPAVLGTAAGLPALPVEVVPLYFELDGSFPNHEANPLEPENLRDLQAAVVEHGADLGLAFDGDADRCFVVDERGEPMSPSAVAAVVAAREIARACASREAETISGLRHGASADERPGRRDDETPLYVIHNLITSRVVPETIEAAGGVPVRTKVGHSLIKDEMAATGAIFGGEHSAHYYFRDFWGADNGMLAALHLLAEHGAQDGPLSALARRYTPYAASGELNSTVTDVPAAYERIVAAFAGEEFDELDGLTVSGSADGVFWWFNVRPSNTEPLLRLNVEAGTASVMEGIRDHALALIRAA